MDKKYFPHFYKENVKRIFRFFFFRVSGRREIAEDLTQDVFVKAFNAFESYDPETSRSAWLYMIARNHFINHLEKTKPGVSLEELEHLPMGTVDWATILSKKYDTARVLDAIESLPEEDKTLVRLKFLEGWGYADIAEVLGKSAATLRVKTHRALKALRAILKHL